MKQKRLTIYHADGTEEVILSEAYEDDGFCCGGFTHIGYSIYLENNVQIIVSPSLHRKIKIEEETI